MRILAIDNSTQLLFLELLTASGDAQTWESKKRAWIPIDEDIRSNDKWLQLQVDSFFEGDEKNGGAFGESSLEAFALGSGPGSFTGLRILFSYFKTLALLWEKPIVGFSSFQFWRRALRGSFPSQDHILLFQFNRNLFLLDDNRSMTKKETLAYFRENALKSGVIWPPPANPKQREEFLKEAPPNLTFAEDPTDNDTQIGELLPAPSTLSNHIDGWKHVLPSYGPAIQFKEKTA